MAQYLYIVVETYRAVSEPSKTPVRARPIAGQGFPPDMHVECSKSMRERHAPGTRFRIRACVKQKLGGKPFLYTSWQWPYEVVA
jgi:hypothetical protein